MSAKLIKKSWGGIQVDIEGHGVFPVAFMWATPEGIGWVEPNYYANPPRPPYHLVIGQVEESAEALVITETQSSPCTFKFSKMEDVKVIVANNYWQAYLHEQGTTEEAEGERMTGVLADRFRMLAE